MTNNAVNNELYQNFSIKAGASGSSRVLRVENENNIASSSAAIETQVGGTSADDTYFRYLISTTNSWAHGIDQTDTQSFNIAYNAGATATPSSTKAIKSTTTGCLLYPSQPIFKAYRNAACSNVTGDGTTYQIIYDVESIDQNNNYNTGTGQFTAPKDGVYLFSTAIVASNVGAGHSGGYFSFRINSTVYSMVEYRINMWRNTSNEAGFSMMAIYELSASDVVDVVFTVYSSTKTIGISVGNEISFFGGCLLG